MSEQLASPREEPPAESPVGARVNSKTGRTLVTGHGTFVDDIETADMRHAVFVRSPYAHAEIESVDTTAAEAMAGVDLVWTAADIEPYVDRFGHPSLDRPDEEALATTRVRYVGDEVAVVLARDRATAKRAADAVDVRYGPLDVVTEPDAALAPDAPVLHPELSDDPDCEVDGNRLHETRVLAGDVESAMAEADHVIEASFETNQTNPSPLEPHGCVAAFNPGSHELTLTSSSQVPHLLKEYLADAIVDLDVTDIVCKMPEIGGGFGVKLELLSHEVCATVLSMVTERPVKCVLDRLEELRAGRGRHAESFDARLGLTADGAFVALDIDMVQNTGAYGSFGKTIAFSSMATAAGPYPIHNQRLRGTVVYTNVMPGCAVRGYGDPQMTFVREQLVDMAADELGMEAIELRKRNVPSIEAMPLRTPTGLKWENADMLGCIDTVRDAIDWDAYRGGTTTPDGTLRGVGLGTIMKRGGNKSAKGADFASAIVELNKHGEVTVFSGITSIGQGTETGIAQIVADELGVSTDRVTPVVGDSDITPDDMGVWADRGTIMSGTAAAMAARELRETLERLAAHWLEADRSSLVFEGDVVTVAGDRTRSLHIEDLAHRATFGDPDDRPAGFEDGVPLVGRSKFETREAEFLDPETGTGNISHGYTFGALAALVEIDAGTGEVEVVDIAICEDVGKAINPTLIEGQIQGGIVHALGEALLEELVYDDRGNLQNGTLVDYHLPTAADVPLITKIEELENPDPNTSHGQRGVGECSTVPVTAAVANAVADATGIRFHELPLTPDRVLPALVDAGLRTL